MTREEEIEKMLAEGELGILTECAYGKTIADEESKNTVKSKEK